MFHTRPCCHERASLPIYRTDSGVHRDDNVGSSFLAKGRPIDALKIALEEVMDGNTGSICPSHNFIVPPSESPSEHLGTLETQALNLRLDSSLGRLCISVIGKCNHFHIGFSHTNDITCARPPFIFIVHSYGRDQTCAMPLRSRPEAHSLTLPLNLLRPRSRSETTSGVSE